MAKFKITHLPPGAVHEVEEELEATTIQPIDAGDAHFLAFSWVSGAGTDIRLILPAATVNRIEKVD